MKNYWLDRSKYKNLRNGIFVLQRLGFSCETISKLTKNEILKFSTPFSEKIIKLSDNDILAYTAWINNKEKI